MTLAERLRAYAESEAARGEDGVALNLEDFAVEAEKLTKAVAAFDAILFPSDLSGDEQAAHMRDQLVTDLADAMDRHGWAGTLEENIELVERITNLKGKVLVTPCEIKSRTICNAFNGSTSVHFPAVLTDVILGLPTFTGHGINHGDALVNLQRKVDGL